MLFLLFLSLFSSQSQAQTIAEKIIRESPRLAWSLGMTADSNFQEAGTYDSRQGLLFRVTPRYKLSDKYLLIASTGFSQRATQETRSDLINTNITISRMPFAVGKYGDMRTFATLVLPTNEWQRKEESFLGALRAGSSFFVRTHSPFIWEMGGSATWNNHQYSIASFYQPNIQWRLTPYTTVGWVFKGRWQLMMYADHTTAWTYRGTERNFFTLDESITYIGGRRWSATLGHTNAGSVANLDGRGSNVAFFDARSSMFYINGTVNY